MGKELPQPGPEQIGISGEPELDWLTDERRWKAVRRSIRRDMSFPVRRMRAAWRRFMKDWEKLNAENKQAADSPYGGDGEREGSTGRATDK